MRFFASRIARAVRREVVPVAPVEPQQGQNLTGRVVLETSPKRVVAYHLWPVDEEVWEGSFAATNHSTALMFLARHGDGRLHLEDGRLLKFMITEFSPPAIFRVTGRLVEKND